MARVIFLATHIHPPLTHTQNHYTALIWAGRMDHPEVVKVLVAAGANVNATAEVGPSLGGRFIRMDHSG